MVYIYIYIGSESGRNGSGEGGGEGQRQREKVSSFQEEIQSEELRGAAGRLDFWCIGVLIPALNYPLSWAQLGPLVKTPPLFVLRNR